MTDATCDGHVRFYEGRADVSACSFPPQACAFDMDGNHIGDFCPAHLFAGIALNLDPAEIVPGADPEDVTVRIYRPEAHPDAAG